MRNYELTLIYTSDEELYKSASQKVKAILKDSGATIDKEEDKGVRELAYDIKKESKGRYIFSLIKAEPASIVEIERKLKIEAGLLKFLFIKANE